MRLRISATVLAVSMLAGCQTKQLSEMSYNEQKELAGKIAQRCIDQGYTKKSPEADACLKHEVEREAAIREKNAANARRAGMAVSQGFTNYGQTMSRPVYSLPSTSHRPINCTSTSFNSWSVNTTCY